MNDISGRRPYKRPALRRLGSVADLTGQGSGSSMTTTSSDSEDEE